MMSERFVLDAVVRDVISNRAFRAVLDNGHELVAFSRGAAPEAPYGPGSRLRVEMSPCDMSKGAIVGPATEDRYESA